MADFSKKTSIFIPALSIFLNIGNYFDFYYFAHYETISNFCNLFTSLSLTIFTYPKRRPTFYFVNLKSYQNGSKVSKRITNFVLSHILYYKRSMKKAYSA